jgi:hypothetical protein
MRLVVKVGTANAVPRDRPGDRRDKYRRTDGEEFGMTIDDIYEAARERGLVHSKRGFSTALLGKAPNYLADRRWSRCSAGALLTLYRRLGEEGQADLAATAFARLLDAEARGGRAPAVRP